MTWCGCMVTWSCMHGLMDAPFFVATQKQYTHMYIGIIHRSRGFHSSIAPTSNKITTWQSAHYFCSDCGVQEMDCICYGRCNSRNGNDSFWSCKFSEKIYRRLPLWISTDSSCIDFSAFSKNLNQEKFLAELAKAMAKRTTVKLPCIVTCMQLCVYHFALFIEKGTVKFVLSYLNVQCCEK